MNPYPYTPRPIKVLHLKGEGKAIGAQHAEAIGQESEQGMLRFYFEFWKRLTEPKTQGFSKNLQMRIARHLLNRYVIKKLAKQLPEFTIELLEGMAAQSRQPLDRLILQAVLPDLGPYLQALMTRLNPKSFVFVRSPAFGCSSYLYQGNRFLHGRNLDFPGVGYWDRYPVIQSVERPGGLKYIGFTSSGIPMSGITGINEAQISVSLHQHYCQETTLSGVLPFVIGEEILFKAQNLKQAVEILDRYKVATSWAFILTDGKNREGLIYECHPRARGIRKLSRGKPALTHSNYFQTAACQPREYSASGRMSWDNRARSERLAKLLAEKQSRLDFDGATQIISDHFDPFWQEEKVFNRTVSQVYNIQSMVLDPEQMRVWLAEGCAPIHLGSYNEFDLGEIFAGREGRTGKSLAGFQFKDENKKKAKEYLIYSFIESMDGRFEGALEQLTNSIEQSYLPEAALTRSVIEMKLGHFREARDHLLEAKAYLERKIIALIPPEYFEICFFLARAHDLLDERSDALKLYRFVANHPQLHDDNLRNMALEERCYKKQKLDQILMPYSTYVPFQ